MNGRNTPAARSGGPTIRVDNKAVGSKAWMLQLGSVFIKLPLTLLQLTKIKNTIFRLKLNNNKNNNNSYYYYYHLSNTFRFNY